MPIITITNAHEKSIQVEVSSEVATFLAENDSYMNRLEHIDERKFALLHFDKRAWENMKKLTTGYNAGDECLGIPEEHREAEAIMYKRRLAQCREWLPLIEDVCTETQWRRFLLHRFNGLSIRKIAAMERCRYQQIYKSIRAVQKKIKKIIAQSV